MGYVIPELQTLLDVSKIKEEYKAAKTIPNPERTKLIDILGVISEIILQAENSDINHDKFDLRKICLGAYLFCLEQIAAEYRALNPDFAEGYFFNSGSKLYQIILKALGITADNQINQQQKLIYLSQFYQYIFKTKKEVSTEIFQKNNMIFVDVKRQVRERIKATFQYNKNEINKVIHAVPTEVAIDAKMEQMLSEYTIAGSNPERKLLARLAQAIAKVLPFDEDQEDQKTFLNRRQRIKMGFLLYVMKDIWNSYYVRNPIDNSILYDLARKALNITVIEDFDPHTRLACLSAFETFIVAGKNIDKLEHEFKLTYLDPHIHIIRKKLDVMIEATHRSIPSSVSPATLSCAAAGALISGVLGYGTGCVLGFTLNQTDGMVKPKLEFAKVTDYALTLILGNAGNYLGYYASDLIVEATLERGFAKVFEALSILVGAGVGGLIGIVIYDLSYQTLRDLCNVYFTLRENIDPSLIKDVDPEFVECLLSLPKDIFSDAEKAKVCRVTYPRMFQVEIPEQLENKMQEDREQNLKVRVTM